MTGALVISAIIADAALITLVTLHLMLARRVDRLERDSHTHYRHAVVDLTLPRGTKFIPLPVSEDFVPPKPAGMHVANQPIGVIR